MFLPHFSLKGRWGIKGVIFEGKGKLGAVLTTFDLKGKLRNNGEAMGCLCHF